MEKRFGRLILFTDHFDDDDWGFAIGIGKTNDYLVLQANVFRYALEISWEF